MLSIISCIALALGLSACKGCGNSNITERHRHNYIQTVTEPTCTMSGYTSYTCECGYGYNDDYTDPLGHDLADNKCTRCDYILHDHIYTVTMVEADCENGGYTQGVCKICGATYKTKFTDPAGHNYENGKCTRCGGRDPNKHFHEYVLETVAPDCENGGYTVFTCECGDSYVEGYTNPLGHDRVKGKCTRCGDILGTEGLKYEEYDSYYSCTGLGTAEGTDIIIPVEHNGKAVIKIEAKAFSSRENITSVTIYASVSSIEYATFGYCSSLERVQLNEELTAIDEAAFLSCINLKSIEIPQRVISIGEGAFSGCESLESVTLGSNLTSIESTAFSYCYKLKDIYFNGTRAQWNNISKVVGWDYNAGRYTDAGKYTLHCTDDDKYEKELEYTLSDNGKYYICSGIGRVTDSEIVIASEYNGKPVKKIGDSAFHSNKNIKKVVIPDSVIAIGHSAFANCERLESLILPDSLTSIGNNLFENCNNLKYNEYNNAKYLGNADNPYMLLAEAVNTDITTCAIHENTKIIYNHAFFNCDMLTDVEVPESLTYIGDNAFGFCSNLTNITIPNGINYIGLHALLGCFDLKYNLYGDGYYLGNAENPYLVLVNISTFTGSSFTVQEGTKIIMDSAFSGGSSLTEIIIPDGVVYIGAAAFAFREKLTSIILPDSVSVIDSWAFWGCSSLTSITIPAGVTYIGETVFRECYNLKIIEYTGTKEQWSDIEKGDDWDGDTGDYTVYATDGKIYKDGTVGYRPTEGLEYTLSDDGTYYICSGIGTATDIDIVVAAEYDGKPVKMIGNSAFSISSVFSVYIPEGVTVIGGGAFDNCANLTEIHLPSSLTEIGDYAFFGCRMLKSVTLPDGLTSIGKYAFSWCQSLKSIVIPKSVTAIGTHAFGYCDNLTVYCEAASRPNGWNIAWNGDDDPCTVIWDCKSVTGTDYDITAGRKRYK